MQEGLTVLERAKRDAMARLRTAEAEGDKSGHKLQAIRHAIRSIEEAQAALLYMYEQKQELIRAWNIVEEGNRRVQIHGSTSRGRRRHGKR